MFIKSPIYTPKLEGCCYSFVETIFLYIYRLLRTYAGFKWVWQSRFYTGSDVRSRRIGEKLQFGTKFEFSWHHFLQMLWRLKIAPMIMKIITSTVMSNVYVISNIQSCHLTSVMYQCELSSHFPEAIFKLSAKTPVVKNLWNCQKSNFSTKLIEYYLIIVPVSIYNDILSFSFICRVK